MSIYNYKSKEFFINLSPNDIPPKGHADRADFVKREVKKCTDGFNVNGVFIPGSFYYDINYHVIELDTEEGRKKTNPFVRDNGWIMHNDYLEAQKQKKHYCIGGSRQCAKSDFIVSLTMRELMVYENTTALLLFMGTPDIQTFTGKLKTAHDNLVDFLKVPVLDKDFGKEFLRFGYKETTNDDELHARLYLLNTNQGRNAQVGSGKSLTYFAYDEIGKGKHKAAFNKILPAFTGKYGIRNSGILAFTGGDVGAETDTEKFFMNPDSNNLLKIDGTGRFMSGHYRASFKETTTFGEYLQTKDGILLPKDSELFTIPADVTNHEKAEETLEAESTGFLKSGEIQSYNEHKIAYPRKVSDMFLKEEANPFSHLAPELERLYEYLNTQDYEKMTYKLVEMGDKVEAVAIDQNYDHTSTNLDQPIVIIDKPRNIGEGKLYCLGLDPINVDKSSQSGSKASFYVMRKTTSNYADPFQDTMVAWYNGRKDLNDMREKARLILKYYGADMGAITMLHEAADDTLTQWFMDKRLGFWLEDTYQLSKEIFSNTKAFAAKGLRPTTRNQNYYIGRMVEYLEEELPDGRKGLWRIKDKLLVKQLLSFEGNLGVCDAVVGFGHTLTHIYKERKFTTRLNETEQTEEKSASKAVEDWNMFGFNLQVKKHTRSII